MANRARSPEDKAMLMNMQAVPPPGKIRLRTLMWHHAPIWPKFVRGREQPKSRRPEVRLESPGGNPIEFRC
jgi:hypothetical protein